MIRTAGIVEESFVDGPGIRFVVFAQGCSHNCTGCHNPHTHDFNGGSFMSIDEIISRMRKNPLLDGITLSGGEPFEQADKMGLLAARTKEMGYDVMAYSGYRYEEILEKSERDKGWQSLILNTDILVDGRFELENKDLLLKFRGSKNQRIIDVKESMKFRKAIILD